jgi:exonuclease VII small subunit
MMRISMASLCLFLLLLQLNPAKAQDSSAINAVIGLPDKFNGIVSGKADEAAASITKQTDKYLSKLQKEEAKLYKKLYKIDSVAANNIFTKSQERYEQLKNKVKDKTGKIRNGGGGYLPWLDTMNTALKFLEQQDGAIGKIAGAGKDVKAAMGKVKEFERQLKEAENIKELIKQRKQYLNEALKKYNLGNALKKYNKEAWYYAQQLNEIKEVWQDPSKIEAKAIGLLRKLPAFEKFFQQFGELAGVFTIPQDYATNMNGLQTVSMVQNQLQNRIAAIGPNAQQTVQQNIQAAQASLTQIRNRINQFGQSQGSLDMPDFKPNIQRTKSFKQRLEYGSNFQTVKSTTFFPLTSDLGLSLGYKLSDKSIIGIGGSYKLGWGKDIRHIRLSHQGIGLRTYGEWKLKGNFYISGGAEWNYRYEFRNFSVLNDFSGWQKSALVGLSKKYSIGKKWKGNVQVLFDFLYKKQIPQTQPVVFRTGYTF